MREMNLQEARAVAGGTSEIWNNCVELLRFHINTLFELERIQSATDYTFEQREAFMAGCVLGSISL
jgi:hypothetical protein